MECAICLEEGNLIIYNHNNKCGNISVHDSCLSEWFLSNDNECPICRENLVNDYELLSSDSDTSPTDIILRSNRRGFDDRYLLFIIVFLLFIFFLIFLLLLSLQE
jgi:hypothetical protein